MDMCIWLCKDTGAMNRSPTPNGLFAMHFVGVCGYFTDCLLAFCGIFAMHWQSLRDTFTECSQRVSYLYVTYSLCKKGFLRCKSVVFGVQKPPFYIAKTPFLKCNILNKEHGTTKCGIIYKVYCHRILMLNLVETRCSGIMVWCAFGFLVVANTLQNGV